MTAYHRLARETPGFRHWRLPVAWGLGAVAYVGINIVVALVMVAVAVASGRDLDAWASDLAANQIDLDDPVMLALVLGLIALMIPCVLVPVRVLWPRHSGYLHSVDGRLRWRWLARCTAWAFVIVTAALALSIAVALAADPDSVHPILPGATALASLAVVVLVVPFQAAGEEYVFRGAVMQLVGSWTRWAVVPVLVSTLLFALSHGYEFWGLVSVGVFGLFAAVITIRTGGLEGAIGLHIANNVVLMVLDILGLVDSSGEGASAVGDVLPTVALALVYWLVLERAARRAGLHRSRAPLADPPSAGPRPPVVPPPPYVPPGVAPGVGPTGTPPSGTAPVVPPPPYVPPRIAPQSPSYPGDPGAWGR